MLQFLNIPPLSSRHTYLKLTTMYNIVGNNSYFPSGIFVPRIFPYSTNHHTNFIRPFARTQYMYSSFVPSVITMWNTLPDPIKHSSSISSFKRSLRLFFFLKGSCIILAMLLFMVPCVLYDTNIIEKIKIKKSKDSSQNSGSTGNCTNFCLNCPALPYSVIYTHQTRRLFGR